LSKAQGPPKIPSNSGGLVEGAEGGGVRVTEEKGFFEWPGVKCMSSLPRISVNYFSPLNIEESTETESMLDSPQKAEREREWWMWMSLWKEQQSGCCG